MHIYKQTNTRAYTQFGKHKAQHVAMHKHVCSHIYTVTCLHVHRHA